MKDVWITQAQAITALGPDVETLFAALMAKQTGIKKVRRFDTSDAVSSYAALVGTIEPENPNRSLIFDLSDQLLEKITSLDPETLLITASTKAGIDLLEPGRTDTRIDPDVFPAKLPAYLAGKLGLKQPGFNINSACASSTIAVAKGASLIRMGHADCVAVCSMDIISDFTFSGFSALRAMSEKPAAPFDKNRSGLTLGEGAAVIVMMSREQVEKTGADPLAKICGWGIANDASHITAPAKDARGLKLAISSAVKQAGISFDRIGAVSAHGTGTVYNDLMELTALNALFKNACPPANSIKGAIGHTLGAAGGIEVALCVEMLEQGVIPGTVGFKTPEKGAETIISPDSRRFDKPFVLTTNSGFGGTNGALILERSQV